MNNKPRITQSKNERWEADEGRGTETSEQEAKIAHGMSHLGFVGMEKGPTWTGQNKKTAADMSEQREREKQSESSDFGSSRSQSAARNQLVRF